MIKFLRTIYHVMKTSDSEIFEDENKETSDSLESSIVISAAKKRSTTY